MNEKPICTGSQQLSTIWTLLYKVMWTTCFLLESYEYKRSFTV